MDIKYKALSLGWGIQSFTLAAMSALGELERPDVAIHSDTTHESILTYQHAKKWTPWLEELGIRVVTVSDKKAAHQIWSGKMIPAYTRNPRSKYGQALRTCTQRWKIAPMRRWLQVNRNKQPVELWLGISTDEALRMKPSDVKYITHRWPLIELGMSRKDCEAWLKDHRIEVPPKSACTFCPYHNTAEWRRIKNTPEDWKEAIEVDQAIRQARPPYDLFVHPSRKPLEDVDLALLKKWDKCAYGMKSVKVYVEFNRLLARGVKTW